MWGEIGVNVQVEVVEYSVRAEKGREKSYKGGWWADPTSTLGDPDGMMWRLLGPGGPMDYWRDPRWDELGNAARFSVDERFRGQAYREMTKIFLENLPWLPVIQRSEEHTSELQSHLNLVCRLLLEKKNEPKTHMLYITCRYR